MAVSDRRSGSDRRRTKRYEVNIDVEWENSDGRHTGTISDISLRGCFVLCSGEVSDGETIKVFIPLADGIKVEFRCEVVNHVLEIGFGARFESVSPPQKEFVKGIIKSSKK